MDLDRIGQYVDLCVDAQQQVFVIRHRQKLLKQVPIKGLHKAILPFEHFADLICQQALSEQRRLQQACRLVAEWEVSCCLEKEYHRSVEDRGLSNGTKH